MGRSDWNTPTARCTERGVTAWARGRAHVRGVLPALTAAAVVTAAAARRVALSARVAAEQLTGSFDRLRRCDDADAVRARTLYSIHFRHDDLLIGSFHHRQ